MVNDNRVHKETQIANRPIIQIRDLTKSYGRMCVFDNLSLQVHTGSSTRIIAPNGAGKTTLFKILLGFTNIDQGEIHLFGELSHKNNIANSQYLDTCCKYIGYVPEETVFYNYLSPSEYPGYSKNHKIRAERSGKT